VALVVQSWRGHDPTASAAANLDHAGALVDGLAALGSSRLRRRPRPRAWSPSRPFTETCNALVGHSVGERIGHECLDHSGKRHPGLDRVTAGSQLFDLDLGEADAAHKAITPPLAVAVALRPLGRGPVVHAGTDKPEPLNGRLPYPAAFHVTA
jgi:hypothetical protein